MTPNKYAALAKELRDILGFARFNPDLDEFLRKNKNTLLEALDLASKPRITVEMLEGMRPWFGNCDEIIGKLIRFLNGEIKEEAL